MAKIIYHPKIYSFLSRGVSDTLKIGKAIAKHLNKGDIVCLFGNLGAGKTVLVKGIAEGLGIKRNKIISPTFVLIHEYKRDIPLYHFDLYRLENPKDIFGLGYEEYFFNDGITVIEWADRLKYLLPGEFLKIELLIKTNSERLFKLRAFGRHYEELLKNIHENISH
jgi:tRNA threonylcarbamoyladenosine biosynthesis protein TsaE